MKRKEERRETRGMNERGGEGKAGEVTIEENVRLGEENGEVGVGRKDGKESGERKKRRERRDYRDRKEAKKKKKETEKKRNK